MYFSKQEVELIRAAAAAMPLGGARDSGKAQLSSLTDYAAAGTLDALIMDIDARERGGKLRSDAADTLGALLSALSLSEEEIRRLPDAKDERQRERALAHKRAMALRYVNKLRTAGFARPPAHRRPGPGSGRR